MGGENGFPNLSSKETKYFVGSSEALLASSIAPSAPLFFAIKFPRLCF